MSVPEDLSEILDRIAQGEETEGDRQLLRQLLREEQGQNLVQLGKYTVNLGQGREIQVGDRIYQGADADTVKTVLQAVLQQQTVPRSSLTAQEYRNRQALLSKVKNFWVKGVLETSLHHQVALHLGLEDRSNVLATSWNLRLERTEATQTVLPQNTCAIDLFDQLGAGRTLLILGEPGAGKTITLLQLARELLDRAEQDVNHLIPVVFNLSTWSNRLPNIADWLVAELNTKYQVPKPIAHPWVTQQQLLLLLDGLDEVRTELREACVVALNQFQQRYGTEMVVCSRIKDYEALSHRLNVQQAIYVRSLRPSQIEQYLNDLNADLRGLKQVLNQDAALQELARSPLMLNIMVLAYEGVNADSLPGDSVEAHRQRLFNTYIDRMLQRRGETRYSAAQTLRWLSWLAQQMVHFSQTIFLIEWLDYHWLQTPRQRWIYIIMSSLLAGLAFGIIITFSVGAKHSWLTVGLWVWGIYSLVETVASWLVIRVEQMAPSPRQVFLQRLVNSLATGLLTGLIFGMVASVSTTLTAGWLVGLLSGFVVGATDWWIGGMAGMSFLKPVEALRWSWMNVRKYLIFGLIGAAHFTLLMSLIGVFTANWIEAVLVGSLGGLIFGLLAGLRTGAEIETRITPNQGIWRSAKTSVIVATTVTLGCSLLLFILERWLSVSMGWAVFYGLFVGLLMGGTACIIHISLRIIFYAFNKMPWNYARFLDYCVDRLFLQKVGGGYIFIHRLLMEHFASMPIQK